MIPPTGYESSLMVHLGQDAEPRRSSVQDPGGVTREQPEQLMSRGRTPICMLHVTVEAPAVRCPSLNLGLLGRSPCLRCRRRTSSPTGVNR